MLILLSKSIIPNYTLSAASGSYTLAGQDVSLARSYGFSAASGEFLAVGNDATLSYTEEDTNGRLSAHSGTFVFGGSEASFIYTPVAGWQSVNPTSASWTRIR